MPAAPGGKKSSTGKYVAIGCGVLFGFCCISNIIYQVACGGMAAMMNAGSGYEAPDYGSMGQAEGGGGGGAASGNVCERAVTCCNDYVNAIPGGAASGAASACDSLRSLVNVPGAESGCQQTIDTYRTTLQQMSIAVPASCQ
jgi:hypothetical protein